MITKITNDGGLHLVSIVNCIEHQGFVTAENEPLQVSVNHFKLGSFIDLHSHIDIDKCTDKTIEAWVVLNGEIKIIISDGAGFDRSMVVGPNNIVIRFAGFHALEAQTNDCIVLEFRNGPYLGRNAEIKPGSRNS